MLYERMRGHRLVPLMTKFAEALSKAGMFTSAIVTAE
jgi:hypothetical protein